MQSVPPVILGAPHGFRFRHRQGGEGPTIIIRRRGPVRCVREDGKILAVLIESTSHLSQDNLVLWIP